MKTRLPFIAGLSGLLFSGSLYAQNVISNLKQFRNNADMAYYAQVAQKNIEECHKAQCEKWNVSRDTNRPPLLDLSGNGAVPMLAIQFARMDNFDWETGNIYDHMIIDSLRVFTFACVDKEMNVHAFANYFDGEYAYADLKSVRPDEEESLRQVIRNINRRQPEKLLYSHSLRKEQEDLNGFMYVKGDSIYVYRPKENDTYELNDYVARFFDVNELRNLGMSSVPFIHQYYDKEESRCKVGNLPSDKSIIKKIK